MSKTANFFSPLYLICIYVLFTFSLTANAGQNDEINFLGLNEGKEDVQTFNQKAISKEMPRIFESLIASSKEAFKDQAIEAQLTGLNFSKKTLNIGASIGASAGLGTLLTFEAVPSFYLIFEK